MEGAYPYLWLDAKVEKVRAGGRVEHRALVVAYGVDASGQREVIGLDVGAAETQGRSGGSSSARWCVAAFGASAGDL
jgi:transposase-like protein